MIFFTPVRIAGTGHALPRRSLSSETWDQQLGFPRGHLEAATGVRSRFVCDGEDQIDLALAASREAISASCVCVEDLDLVLGACAVPYQLIPSTAPLVMQKLGVPEGRASGHDVNSTCLSFLTAFDLAAGKIASGQIRTALIFSSEIASRALPWKDQPEVAALFGDGAAAAVLTRANAARSGICANLMRSYPAAYEACRIGAGGTRIDFHAAPAEFAKHAYFQMDGKALFRVTRRHFPAFVQELLAAAGWSVEDVDLVVPHQASPLALRHMVEHVGFTASRVVDIVATHGNQIAASIPTALDIAWRAGRIAQGSRVLFVGTSAGVSFGGLAVEI